MAFGTKLKLEGRSEKSPEWGVFKTIMIAAETCDETSDSATERVRHHLERQAMMWQQNYDLELQFRVVEVIRMEFTTSERTRSQAVAQPTVSAREANPENYKRAYSGRRHPNPAPAGTPLVTASRASTFYSISDRRRA